MTLGWSCRYNTAENEYIKYLFFMFVTGVKNPVESFSGALMLLITGGLRE